MGKKRRKQSKGTKKTKKTNKAKINTYIAILGVVIISIFFISTLVFKGYENKRKALSIEERVEYKINKMSIRDKVNQMMIVSMRYTIVNNEIGELTQVNSLAKDFLRKNQPGGVILSKLNMKEFDQTKKLIEDINMCSRENKFFVSVDEEGGSVSNIPSDEKFESAGDIGKSNNPNSAYVQGESMGEVMKELGINLNFAPVVDINHNSFLGDRTYGNTEESVSNFAVKFIEGLKSQGILTTAKHFVGYGGAIEDPHEKVAKNTSLLEAIESDDLKPFSKAIDAGVDMVMTGHVIVNALDDTNTIATLSKPIVTGLLKEKMGFEGIVVTDAMEMKAITNSYSVSEATKLAINAGCDIILMPVEAAPGLNTDLYNLFIDEIIGYVEQGEISIDRIDEAVYKILELKERKL